MKNGIILTSIQRFSLHDGPGIRTTVFLKGCSLCCPWCSNPENISPSIQAYIKDGIEYKYGMVFSPKELLYEVLRDKEFYNNGLLEWNITSAEQINKLPGGVTFSGGEPLLQFEGILPVIKSIHELKIHVAVETSLYAPKSIVQSAIYQFDLFYVDLKILDNMLCSTILKNDLKTYLDNLEILMQSKCPIIIRIPVIGSYTDSKNNREAIKKLLNKYKERILKIELLKEHNLAAPKYSSLGLKFDYHGVDDLFLNEYKKELNDLRIPIEICKV